MKKKQGYWNLYWVVSDGFEDCFVVARNSRSARSVEYHTNGFDFSYVQAIKIMRIPKAVERAYKRQESFKNHPWPNYVYGKKFFEDLGANFRSVAGKEEMLLEEIVFRVEEYVPCGILWERVEFYGKELWGLEQLTILEIYQRCVILLTIMMMRIFGRGA